MKQKKRVSALMTVCVMAASAAFPALGAPTGPGLSTQQEKYDGETLERLLDNVLEFDEIALRVREYNPTIVEAWESYNDRKQDYANMLTELESQYNVVKENADGLIQAGMQMGELTGDYSLVVTGRTLRSSYKAAIDGVKKTVSGWDTNRQATGNIRKYEKQITSGAQSAMIGLETIRKNVETLEITETLYQKQVDMYSRMVEQGLATSTEVLTAQSQLLSTRSQLASLNGQLDSTRRTLCMMLGYDPDSNLDIRPLPAFDMSRIDQINLEQDTAKAIGNNYTLISQRTEAAGKTTAHIENRLKVIEEGDQKLTVEMQRLYQDVMDKRAAYEAAVTGFAAAEANRGASERQYTNGLISEVQYVGTQISYYRKKAERESAELGLWQAMETYDWAVNGLATVE